MPGADFLYCADCGNAPWGDRPSAFIEARCRAMTAFMQDLGACEVVFACNTATAVAADALRADCDLPIIGIEPAVKPAAKDSRAGRIGVLATTRTITSDRYRRLVERFAADCEVISQPAPGLMECVERGEFDAPATRALLARYLGPMLERGVDAVVLGCTHYPFLAPAIAEIAGPGVAVIDPARPVAAVALARLPGPLPGEGGRERFYVKGAAAALPSLRLLWPSAADVRELPV
ncbi:MAG: glutamate racemase [Duodenibacillus sp.]|nr:glutamate racemase [Duodenibacillus sp.]